MLPTLKWRLFPPGEDHRLSQNKLLYALEGMVRANQDYLRAYPETPLLYRSGIRYQREPDGQEEWCDIPNIIAAGWGDCEDLAAWLVAELREKFKMPARPFLRFRKKAGEFHYHALLTIPHHYVWKPVMHPQKNIPLLDPQTGRPAAMRAPVFTGKMGEFVFEDPSARLGMYGGKTNVAGAYEQILARGRDPIHHALVSRRYS
jgi:hypothetical protein